MCVSWNLRCLSSCAECVNVKRDLNTGLFTYQKRPTNMSKETYKYCTAKETSLQSKRDLLIRQKRPPCRAKETYSHGVRVCQKRPTNMAKETSPYGTQTCVYGKSDLLKWQKRPTYTCRASGPAPNAESGRRECCVRKCAKRQKKPLHTAKETCLHGKRDLRIQHKRRRHTRVRAQYTLKFTFLFCLIKFYQSIFKNANLKACM